MAITNAKTANGTLTPVASSVTSVGLFAANGRATFRTLFNDSTANLFISFSSTASSTTSFTVKLAAGAYYELPFPLYCGAVTGIWDAANGFARLTEY